MRSMPSKRRTRSAGQSLPRVCRTIFAALAQTDPVEPACTAVFSPVCRRSVADLRVGGPAGGDEEGRAR
ncbi:hypothetical protein [Streptomyces sp. NPDC050164]|uniref:hypothetical protein n=1 Tax=Streptomyces sp. NPDC050164 TaxID=3365605 RepID=UPI0037A8A51E